MHFLHVNKRNIFKICYNEQKFLFIVHKILILSMITCYSYLSLYVSTSSSSCRAASTDLPYLLSPPVYCPLLPGGLQGYVLYQHRAVVYGF